MNGCISRGLSCSARELLLVKDPQAQGDDAEQDEREDRKDECEFCKRLTPRPIAACGAANYPHGPNPVAK
jgi:hypothetical protein